MTERFQFRIKRSLSCELVQVRLNHHRQQVNIPIAGQFMNENLLDVQAVTGWRDFYSN